MNYQKGYYLLLSEMSKAVTELSQQQIVSYATLKAIERMQRALEEAEEMYLKPFIVVSSKGNKNRRQSQTK